MNFTRIRTLIADDEPIARDTLRILLEADREITIVGECRNGIEAVTLLRELSVDLVFLDIRMPKKSGLDVVREIGPENMPTVVFVTAFTAHAVAAFEQRALDYVLKPFDEARFALALDRAKEAVRARDQAELGRRLEHLVRSDADSPPARVEQLERVPVRIEGVVALMDPQHIDFAEAADYCVRIHEGGRQHVLRESLEALEKRLPDRLFMRVHRSFLVNVDKIVSVRRLRGGEAIANMSTGREVRVSRTRRAALERRVRIRD